MTFRVPPTNKAGQKLFPKEGISIKNNNGNKKGNEKNLNDQDTIYSSMFSKVFLQKISFIDSKNADNNANMNQTISFF